MDAGIDISETLHGTGPLLPRTITPPAHHILRPIGDEISEVGARPLVDDMKLGWDTSVSNKAMGKSGSATRLSSEIAESEYRIKSDTGWLIFAIVLLLCVAGAVVTIALTT